METALWELLDNAAKHTSTSPSVDVDVSTTEDEVVIRVADNGLGLPTIERSVLTSGEETPLVHGQGFGLWVVYWIVTGLDGTLKVVAGDAADGTAIDVRLPRAP